jgi:hypothetical protein
VAGIGLCALGVLAVRHEARDNGTPISSVTGAVRSARLDLDIGVCDAELEGLLVRESADDVHLRVDTTDGSTNDCAMGVQVELDRPLGERRVFDDVTGDEVPVTGVRRPVPITEVLVSRDDETLLVVVHSCGLGLRVRPTFAFDTVALAATQEAPSQDCAHRKVVELTEPVAGRLVVDRPTGEPVRMIPS